MRRLLPPLLLAAVWTAGLAVTFVNLYENVGESTDFVQDYFGALLAAGGRSPYGPGVGEVSRGTIANAGSSVPSYHPPMLLMLLSPLASFDYPVAYYLLGLSNVGLIVYLGNVAARRAELGPAAAPFVAPLLLVWNPAQTAVLYGTVTVALACLLAYAQEAAEEGRSLRAGAAVGVASACKLYPLAFLAYFLVRRDYAALAASASSFLFLVAAGLLFAGPAAFVDYVTEVVPEDAARFGTSIFNVSLRGAVYPLLVKNPYVAHSVSAPAAAAGLVCAAWVAAGVAVLRAARGRAELPRDPFGAAVALMLLLSPVTWTAALLCVVPAAAGAWRRVNDVWFRLLLVACLLGMSLPSEILLTYVTGGRTRPPVTPAEWALAKWDLLGLAGFFVLLLTERRFVGQKEERAGGELPRPARPE